MPTLSDEEIDARFKALADHNRRVIIAMVYRNPGITLQEISAKFPISRFAVMNHINLVERSGLIRSEKESIYRHFYPVHGSTDELFESWRKRIEEEV
ncbi:MAG: winged helix-turn-helix domain-containing protein [Spirochaetota bacterium]